MYSCMHGHICSVQPVDGGLEVELEIYFSFAIEGVRNLEIYVGTSRITDDQRTPPRPSNMRNIAVYYK